MKSTRRIVCILLGPIINFLARFKISQLIECNTVRGFWKILEKPFYRQCGIVVAYVLLLCGDI